MEFFHQEGDAALQYAASVRQNAFMKLRIFTIILVIACIVLGVLLLQRHKEKEKFVQVAEVRTAEVANVSNQLADTSVKLDNQIQENVGLKKDIEARTAEVLTFSNKTTDLSAQLDKANTDARAAAQAAATEIAKRETRITELETQREARDKRINDLTNALAQLQKHINETEGRLAVSEGDREFLLKELKRLQSEKAELERQFHDMRSLKDQIGKLRDELAVARRLEFIRSGVFGGMKGAEQLVRRTPPAAPKSTTNFNLNVEFKQDGGARVVTNAPPK